MAYKSIDEYGLIGNMHTAALVGADGSLDWLCLPHFDSPSVFAALLDDRKGGHFQIAPIAENVTRRQYYIPDTNVLVTRLLTAEGTVEVVDFMPMEERRRQGPETRILRRVQGVRGDVQLRLQCQPAFDFGRRTHTVERGTGGFRFRCDTMQLALMSPVPLNPDGELGVQAEFRLREGETVTFILQHMDPHAGEPESMTEDAGGAVLDATIRYWRRWIDGCNYTGRWRETVRRSALTLKLLTFAPSGAMIAAPTTSLPEAIGGRRNWDYRYAWIRDSAFVVYAFMRLGFTEEANAFMRWVESCCRNRNRDGSLPVVYTIAGERVPAEEELTHLAGYRDSQPVRIGNAAAGQLQLDIYGELLDSVYLYNKYVTPISYDFWQELREMLNWVSDHWMEKDQGIWEMRTEPRHFVSSKLMCWVALDRGLRLAQKRSFPADRERWGKARDAIYREIQEQGWNPERRAFTQSYGSDVLDASVAIVPMVFFMSPTDPRVISTIDAMRQPRARGGLMSGGLVHRYTPSNPVDGLESEEGSFNLCSYWLVEALTRSGRTDKKRLGQARRAFEEMLSYNSPLGLCAEQTGGRGEALGNYPQAFTHLALISAAVNLDRALSSDPFDWPGLPASDWTRVKQEKGGRSAP